MIKTGWCAEEPEARGRCAGDAGEIRHIFVTNRLDCNG